MVVEANLFSRVARVFRSYANAIGALSGCTSTLKHMLDLRKSTSSCLIQHAVALLLAEFGMSSIFTCYLRTGTLEVPHDHIELPQPCPIVLQFRRRKTRRRSWSSL